MAALGEAAARWAPGLWRRAARSATGFGGRRFASGSQVRAESAGRRREAVRPRGPGSEQGVRPPDVTPPALPACGDITSPGAPPRGSLAPRGSVHRARGRGVTPSLARATGGRGRGTP